MEFTRASHDATGILSCGRMFETLRSSTFRFRMLNRVSSPLHSASLARQWSSWRCVWGSLSCWNTALPPNYQRGDHALLQYFRVHVGIHGSLNELSHPSASSTHAAPDHDTPTTMLDCRQDTLVFLFLTWLLPHTLDAIWTKQVGLGLIRPQDMAPVIHVHSLLVFSKLFAGFLVQ